MDPDLIPKVAILMGCFNGAKHISEQLESIASQTHLNWCLFASDDGSTDETIDILKAYQSRWGGDKLVIIMGPRAGFCRNFLTLATNPDIVADFYAFCDQDDVWKPNKIERSLSDLANHAKSIPALYCASTSFVDRDLNFIGLSPLPTEVPGFGNALFQNIAGGNTMVFSSALKKMLERFGCVDVSLHDWWLYILATSTSGAVLYDPEPSVLYRQHEDNLIGKNNSLLSKVIGVKRLLCGEFKRSIDQNLAALERCPEMLTSDALQLLNSFKTARSGSLLCRLAMIHRYGLSRRSLVGLLSLYVAALFKKI